MKKQKLLLSLLLICVLLMLSVTPAFAEDEAVAVTDEDYTVVGDVDADGSVTIIDGTRLQFHIAELTELSDTAILRGDTDLDGTTGISDVTHLQRYITQDAGTYYLGQTIDDAKAAKDSDEAAAKKAEDARIAAEKKKQQTDAQKKQQADAAAKEASEKAERTRQAMQDYQKEYQRLEKEEQQRQEKEALRQQQLEEEQQKQQQLKQQPNQQKEILAGIKNYKREKGVDISEFNGDVDFKKLKAAGYTFVMIRMGFGSNYYDQDDSWFERNVKKAEAAGMPWGAYLYSYALNTTSAKSEVKHSLRLLKGKKPTMPVAFDIESDSYKTKNGMPSNKMLHDICVTYLKGIANAGYYPILYTGYHWLTGALNAKDLTGTYDIWYAQWYTSMDYKNDKIGMWQYGGSVNFLESPYIKGLSGAFDKDFCFKNYPVIITAYGYNNHKAILSGGIASTSASPDDLYYTDEELYIEDGTKLPDEYNGVMGESFR